MKPLSLVDPELVAALEAVPKIDFRESDLATLRSRLSEMEAQKWWRRTFGPLPPPAPQAIERWIPGPPGAPSVRVLIVDPSPGNNNRAAYLHMHGGGFVLGRAALTPTLQRVAQECACVVISVDYRLAPETPFPGSLEDNYAALRWVHANAEELGVDRRRIAVGGESGGGGHAAMLAIAARDRGEVPLAFQLLIYPMLDDRTGSSRPVAPHSDSFIWSAAENRFAWTCLLGVPAGSQKVPEGAVPARIENLAGLAPAFIAVGSLDLFAEENLQYAQRLLVAGVPVELHIVPGAYHGFDLYAPEAGVSRRFTQYWLGALRAAVS